jgi:uncharacterized protein
MPKIEHITPARMLEDSFKLGEKIYRAGFRPKHAISIWRGGTAVGLGVDAYFRQQGLFINHTTIATESYVGMGQQEEVIVKGLEHVIETICKEDHLLLIDDVYETGNTIRKIIETLRRKARANFPDHILVGTIHRKPEKVEYDAVRVCCLYDLPGDTWIDYPHELADLVTDDPEDPLLKQKDPDIWRIIRAQHFEPEEESIEGPYRYAQPGELLLDAMKLGVNIFNDSDFHPNFIVALWPGGVEAGLPLHEVYKYKLKKTGQKRAVPDHISLNIVPTHYSYKTAVLGLNYLAEHISREHNVLLVDSTFKGGRFVNAAIMHLKEVLRRNIRDDRVRVASLYWNPDDQSTWTVRPIIKAPHYYIKKIDKTVVYPYAVHRLADPATELKALNPRLHGVLFPD